jgi:hypothetical protein
VHPPVFLCTSENCYKTNFIIFFSVIVLGTLYLSPFTSLAAVVFFSILLLFQLLSICFSTVCVESSAPYSSSSSIHDVREIVEKSKGVYRKLCFGRSLAACLVASSYLFLGASGGEEYWGRSPVQAMSLFNTGQCVQIIIPYIVFVGIDFLFICVTGVWYSCCS